MNLGERYVGVLSPVTAWVGLSHRKTMRLWDVPPPSCRLRQVLIPSWTLTFVTRIYMNLYNTFNEQCLIIHHFIHQSHIHSLLRSSGKLRNFPGWDRMFHHHIFVRILVFIGAALWLMKASVTMNFERSTRALSQSLAETFENLGLQGWLSAKISRFIIGVTGEACCWDV